jgi:hypothetical protein
MPPKNTATPAPAPTGDGFYLRNNLNCNGTIPSPGPYDLCPDIIQSNVPIPNAQSVLSTQQSWGQAYSTDPTVGANNYYYVRGINGGAAAVDSQIYLYYAPAQLILFPTSWRNNMLQTSKGLDSVNVQADPGHIDVGSDAFVWKNTPVPADGSSHYNFVAQVNGADNANPIPTVTTWLEMSNLLTQNLGFGFRNTCYVDGSAQNWSRRLMLDVPLSMEQAQQLVITLSATGFVGATVGLLADTFGSNQQPIMMLPSKITQDGSATSITIPVEPGFSTSLLIECWGGPGQPPAPGSSITVTVDYLVPNNQLAQAAGLGLINSSRNRSLQQKVGVGPQPVAMLGAASFVVASATPGPR